MSSARTSALSFRVLAAVFFAATAFFVWLFVYEIVAKDQIRTGVATYGILAGLAAFGLAFRQGWGRTLALLLSLATAGLGLLTLLNVMFARRGDVVVPAVVFVLSAAVSFWASRPVFEARDE